MVPPPRPPNFGASGRRGASAEAPASPDPSEPYSPTDTPTRRTTPSPPAYSPDRLHCDRSLYVARHDHIYSLPAACPDSEHPTNTRTPPFGPANPPLQPASGPQRARVRRRAPAPPRPVGRGPPYVRPTIPSEDSAFGRPRLPFGRARNLFADFIPNIQSLPSLPMVRTFLGPQQPARTPSPPPPSRSPSPNIFFQLYQHSRHPVDTQSHLTIIPAWEEMPRRKRKVNAAFVMARLNTSWSNSLQISMSFMCNLCISIITIRV